MTFNLRVFWGGESVLQAGQQYARILLSTSTSWGKRLSPEGVNNMFLKHVQRPTWGVNNSKILCVALLLAHFIRVENISGG